MPSTSQFSVAAAALLPAPGMLKSIHLNALSSVAAPPGWYTESSGFNGPWTNWCGAVFAPDYSELGAMVYWGGGHGGYDGNEFYIFDLTTQKWSRLNDPIPYDFLPETSADWCDVIYQGQPIVPASHTYSHAVYISRAAGGGPKGSWCLPYNVYGGGPGSGEGVSGYRPHVVDLATGKWSRLTINTSQPAYVYGAYGGCFMDTRRNVLWGMAGNEGSVAAKIALGNTPRVIEEIANVDASTAYFVPVQVPEMDMMVCCAVYGDGNHIVSLTGYDLSLGTPVGFAIKFAVKQKVAREGGIGMDWCPDTGKFYLYEGFGTTTVYVATPPANGDWKNGTWTWSTEIMGGEEPANVLEVQPGALGAQPFTKWKYNRALKCFMWSQGAVARPGPDGVMRAGAFQVYRPADSSSGPGIPIPQQDPAPVTDPAPQPSAGTDAFIKLALQSPIASKAAPFKIGHAFKKGEVPAGYYVKTSLPNSVVTPLSRWNDGSVFSAAIMGRVPVDGKGPAIVDLSTQTGSPADGKVLTINDLRAALKAGGATYIQFGTIGTVNLADLLDAPQRVFISTSEMVEARFAGKCPSDEHLHGHFDAQLFATGDVHVRGIGRAGWLNSTDLATRNYKAKVVIGGNTVFEKDYVHGARAAFDQEAWYGADPQITPVHDTVYMMETGIFDEYAEEVTDPAVIDSWSAPTRDMNNDSSGYFLGKMDGYQPGRNLGFSPSMGAAGFQDQIGVIPNWDATYLAGRAARGLFKVVCDHARAAASFSIGYFDKNTLKPARIKDFPLWSVYGDRQGGSPGLGAPSQDGGSYNYDLAHSPSIAFLASLITADYYFIENCCLNALTTYLCNDMNPNSTGAGVKRMPHGQNRQRAWAYRNIAQAAAIYPDSCADQYGELSEWFGNIMAQLAVEYGPDTIPTIPVGVEDLYTSRLPGYAKNGKPAAGVAPFESAFLVAAMGHAWNIEPGDAAGMESLRKFRDYTYNFPKILFGGAGKDEFNFGYASTYDQFAIPTSEVAFGDYVKVSHSIFNPANAGQIFNYSFGFDNPGTNVMLGTSGGDPSLATAYWAQMITMLKYPTQHGAPWAPAAWARLMGADNINVQKKAGYDVNPVWGPRPHGYKEWKRTFPLDGAAPPVIVPPVVTPPTPVPPAVVPGTLTTPSSTKLAKLKNLTVKVFDPVTLVEIKKFTGAVATSKGVIKITDSALKPGTKCATAIISASAEPLVIQFPVTIK